VTVRDRIGAVLLATAIFALTGCETTYLSVPVPPNASEAAQQLDALNVEPQHSMRGYSRERFGGGWRNQGNDCSTRELVLRRDGEDVRTGSSCNLIRGRWGSAYDGQSLHDPDGVEIDHMVPLANAWRSGADQWNDARREAFANDLVNPELLAVSRSSNRAKGDQSPDQWRPPNTRYWCTYARSWITVKYEWNLSVTRAERAALREMLAFC
jgi:hypothetical protein